MPPKPTRRQLAHSFQLRMPASVTIAVIKPSLEVVFGTNASGVAWRHRSFRSQHFEVVACDKPVNGCIATTTIHNGLRSHDSSDDVLAPRPLAGRNEHNLGGTDACLSRRKSIPKLAK